MTARYQVTFSPFGFESDVGTMRLRYAVTDHKPDRIQVWDMLHKENVVVAPDDPFKVPPFRHLAYSAIKEDAEQMVKALNERNVS